MVDEGWMVEDVGCCYWYLRWNHSVECADVYLWKGGATNDGGVVVCQGLDGMIRTCT